MQAEKKHSFILLAKSMLLDKKFMKAKQISSLCKRARSLKGKLKLWNK